MSIVEHMKHRQEVLAAMQDQIVHYRNVADAAEKLIQLMAEAMRNPSMVLLTELSKAEMDYYIVRRKG